MKLKVWLSVVCLMVVISMAHALDPSQYAELREWLTLNPNTAKQGTVVIQRTLTTSSVVGTTNVVVISSRDPYIVKQEKIAKTIAASAGISAGDSLDTMDTKLQTWMGTNPARVYYASVFWACYFDCKTTDGTGNTTSTNVYAMPIYGPSIAEEHGWLLTGEDIEKAQRAAQ